MLSTGHVCTLRESTNFQCFLGMEKVIALEVCPMLSRFEENPRELAARRRLWLMKAKRQWQPKLLEAVACRARSNNFNNIQADKALAWKWPNCHRGFVVCLSEDCGPASEAWTLLSWSSEDCPPEVPYWSSQDMLSSWTWWPCKCNIEWRQGGLAGHRLARTLDAPLSEHAAPPFRVKPLENDASMMTAVCSTKPWNDQRSWKSSMMEHLHWTFTITCARNG